MYIPGDATFRTCEIGTEAMARGAGTIRGIRRLRIASRIRAGCNSSSVFRTAAQTLVTQSLVPSIPIPDAR